MGLVTVIGLLTGYCVTAGCAQAEKTGYVRHLSTIVVPGGDASDRVVAAYRDQEAARLSGAVATAYADPSSPQ